MIYSGLENPVIKARRTALAINFIVIAVEVAGIFAYGGFRGTYVLLWPFYLSAGVTALVSIVVLLFRRPPVILSSFAWLVGVAGGLAVCVPNQVALARSGLAYEPFIGMKIAVFVFALITPFPLVLGYLTIVACGLLPVITYFVFIPPELRHNVAVPEPWTTVLYATLALVILNHRIRESRVEAELRQAKDQKAAAEKLAQMFLAVRDVANTPLQIIEFAAATIHREAPAVSHHVFRMRYAVQRLRALSDVLSTYEAETSWTHEDLLSFDAMKILEKKPPK